MGPTQQDRIFDHFQALDARHTADLEAQDDWTGMQGKIVRSARAKDEGRRV